MKMNWMPQYMVMTMLFFSVSCMTGETKKEDTVKSIMDKTISRLYQTMDEKELAAIDIVQARSFFTEEEKEVLATRHWMFDVNVPVVVSVMRSARQEITPFWLAASGFQKTGMTMESEMTTYEIWQRKFDAGTVGLGINGFANDRLHYFVSVAPQNKIDVLKLSSFIPANQHVGVLDDGAFTYHDWDELVLMNVPELMKGQQLLTTIRGRGTESHLAGAFRKTIYPSSVKADQVMLTWSADPSTSMDVQWRTDSSVQSGCVNYQVKGTSDVLAAEADRFRMEDRELMNDRFTNRFTARLRNLKPGTTYEYLIAPETDWTKAFAFSTAATDESYSFVWFGDTHYSSKFGELCRQAEAAHPDAAFYSIAGDLVSDGLFRNQWDEFFEYSKDVICRKPLMSVPGNHDNRYGLGAQMYLDMFSYPANGPDGVPKEQTYSFVYKNTLFLMIDATSPIDTQTDWIEEQLANSNETWKIAMFHFPPYNWDEPYPDIQKAWVPLFDKYHLDMMFGGHVHYYMRSRPMKGGKVVDSYKDGTVYIISLAIPGTTKKITDEPYAEVRELNCSLYQYLKIDDHQLSYESINNEGKLIDSFSIKK